MTNSALAKGKGLELNKSRTRDYLERQVVSCELSVPIDVAFSTTISSLHIRSRPKGFTCNCCLWL